MGGLTRDSIDASDEAADDGRGMRDAVVGTGMRLRDEPGRDSGRGFTFRSLNERDKSRNACSCS